MSSHMPRAETAWPSVSYEQLPWVSRYERGEASRAQLRLHQGPYAAGIPAQIARTRLVLPTAVAAAVEDAATEIARFDEQAGAVVAPFVRLLLRSEAAASSQIENLTASARAIAQAELLGGSGSANAAQIVSNSTAMTAAVALASDLSERSILAMHHALLHNHDSDSAGKWRDQQVWIGGSRLGPHRAQFVPPQHARISAAIDDLVKFMARDDLPVLAHAALAHAQFETIHPFSDGNGRIGRALIHAMIHGKGLVRHITVPLSAGLLVNVDAYFAALTAYREGDVEPIIAQLADAAFVGISNGRRLVANLRDIRESWADRIRARQNSHSWRIAELVFTHPVLNAELIASSLGLSPSNVYGPLKPLLDAGVLIESGDRTRGRIWRSDEVLRALDLFSARAGRRR